MTAQTTASGTNGASAAGGSSGSAQGGATATRGRRLQISIDRGGTFTDCHARLPAAAAADGASGAHAEDGLPAHEQEWVIKLLSHDPANYKDAPREAVRRVLQILEHQRAGGEGKGRTIPREEKLDTSSIEYIRLSTTVATNALLERKGEKHALVTTKGFKDLVQIGNQSRPRIFDLAIRKPEVLYSAVVEVDERVTLVGYTSDPKARENEVVFEEKKDSDAQEGGRLGYNTSIKRAYGGDDLPPKIKESDLQHDAKRARTEVNGNGSSNGSAEEWIAPPIVQGVSGEAVAILREPNEAELRADLEALYAQGYRSLAVVLMHSFTYPRHEQVVERLAAEVGFEHISLSSKLMPMIKMVPRGTSSTADAYLTPVLQAYIDGFFSGFDASLRDGSAGTKVEFMMSDGGLTSVEHFSGLKSIISGPAGGVVGMALTSYDEKDGRPIIGLDMGGTSTDVSRFAGRYEQTFETTMAGVTIQSPQLDVNTVASGGSSRLFFRNGLFAVGPESASAHPGPTCYRKGGPLTITDANLVTGRLAVEMFPKIFGPNEDEGLDEDKSRAAFEELTSEINKQMGRKGKGKEMSVDEAAQGFIRIANETMCRPIRALTEARGYSASKHILSCFGGAGGQHACALARSLGIKTVLIHQHSSILSAYGMALADRAFERQEPCSEKWEGTAGAAFGRLRRRLEELEAQVRAALRAQGFAEARIETELMLNMRYDGTDTALMTLKPSGEGEESWDFKEVFLKTYRQEFGFVLADKTIVVDDVRVKGIGRSFDSMGESVHSEFKRLGGGSGGGGGEEGGFKDAQALEKATRRPIYFDDEGKGAGSEGPKKGRIETPIIPLKLIETGEKVEGPAVLIDETQTILLEPRCTAFKLSKAVLIDILY